jgi:hypothetical protein
LATQHPSTTRDASPAAFDASKVAADVRLAEELAPHVLSGADLREIRRLLSWGPELEKQMTGELHLIKGTRCPGPDHFLGDNDLV